MRWKSHVQFLEDVIVEILNGASTDPSYMGSG